MRCLYALSFLFALAVVNAEKYSEENDNFDIKAAVANLDTLKGLTGCFLDKSDCDAVAADFKKDIRDATQTSCSKCTAAQKNIYYEYLKALEEKLPSEYADFKKKYDPEGKHFDALKAAVGPA